MEVEGCPLWTEGILTEDLSIQGGWGARWHTRSDPETDQPTFGKQFSAYMGLRQASSWRDWKRVEEHSGDGGGVCPQQRTRTARAQRQEQGLHATDGDTAEHAGTLSQSGCEGCWREEERGPKGCAQRSGVIWLDTLMASWRTE